MENKKNKKNDTKYIGVRKNKYHGRTNYYAEINVNYQRIGLGVYHDPKDAAKAYDLYVIRHNLSRKTNFLKKKLA
jgi:hypothetical protein